MIDEKRLYEALGERIRSLREKSSATGTRMTQAQLAAQVGLERTSITNIEKGVQKVPLHVLFRICEVLSVSVAELLPAVTEVQSSREEAPIEVVDFGGQMVAATPLVKQALASLLNLQEPYGPPHR